MESKDASLVNFSILNPFLSAINVYVLRNHKQALEIFGSEEKVREMNEQLETLRREAMQIPCCGSCNSLKIKTLLP